MTYVIFCLVIGVAVMGCICASAALAVVSGLSHLYFRVQESKDAIEELLEQRTRLAGRPEFKLRFQNQLESQFQPSSEMDSSEGQTNSPSDEEQLIDELDRRIALCLATYNEAARHFNSRCRSFPDVFFARWKGFGPFPEYDLDEKGPSLVTGPLDYTNQKSA